MNRIKAAIIFSLIIGSVVILKPQIETYWAGFMDSTNHNYSDSLKKKWEAKPTVFLINKLDHPSVIYSGVATSLLRDRPSSDEDKIINIINGDHSIRPRTLALSVLFAWDAKKAAAISMEILKAGDMHPLFRDAAEMLAVKKYNPAFPFILEMSKKPNGYNNGSVAMLKHFERPEAIPVLQNMQKKIETENISDKKFFKSVILDAIETIEMKNKPK